MPQAKINSSAACCGGARASSPSNLAQWSPEVKRLQDQVNRSASVCGCVAATLGAALAAVVWSYGKFWPGANMAVWLVSPLAGAGLVLASAVVAKIVGILLGRWRHGVLNLRLRRQMAVEGLHNRLNASTAAPKVVSQL